MFSPILAAMLGAATTISYSLPPAKPQRTVAQRKCVGACARRYRIPAASDDVDSLKIRAVADDGSKCSVVGAKLCTTDGVRLWRSQY